MADRNRSDLDREQRGSSNPNQNQLEREDRSTSSTETGMPGTNRTPGQESPRRDQGVGNETEDRNAPGSGRERTPSSGNIEGDENLNR